MKIKKLSKKLLSKIYRTIFNLFILFLIISWFSIDWQGIWRNPAILLKIKETKAATPAPTFVACGAKASGTGAITPALPTGIRTGDILLLFLETANQAISIPTPNGGTWTEVSSSPQGTGTAGGTAATRLTIFWSRYNGTQGNPTTNDSGDHQVGFICAFRGVTQTDPPYDATAGNVASSASTAVSIPGATTTVPNTLVVVAVANGTDSNTAQTSGWLNSNLSGLTEIADNNTNSGNGGGVGVAIGVWSSTGNFGNTSATLATASVQGRISIALKPPQPTYTQSAYRLFNNLDSTDVGTPLADQDTPATLSSNGAAFRLRLLLHIGTDYLPTNGESFKLQFAQRGSDNLCDTSFNGETYIDVTNSTVIAFNDNPTPSDGQALTANSNDPTHGSDTVVNQTYEEANNFTNSQAAILSGQDGKWDFSLKDNGAPPETTYCFRVVKADGSLLNTYSVIPQITTAALPALTCTLSATSTSFSSLSPSIISTSTPDITITITSSGGFQITVKDSGNGINPGLYKSTAPTYLIQSSDSTLTVGYDGYGIQATTTNSNITINQKYNKTGNNVGGLSLTDIILASSTSAVSNAQINIKHKASASYLAPTGSYSDTITYSCTPL